MKKKLIVSLILIFLLHSAATVSFAEAGQSVIRRAIAFLSEGKPTGFHFTVQLGKSPVFGESRTEQLNKLLKHFDFDGVIDDNLSEITVSINDQKLFGISQIHLAAREMTCLSDADGKSYIIPSEYASEFKLQSFQDTSDSYLLQKNIYQSLESYLSLIKNLPDEYPEKTGSAKILEKYRYYGAATRRVTVNITGDELNSYVLKRMKEFGENELFPDLSVLSFESRQGFTLLFTDDNQLISITYSGKIRLSEDDLREVRLDWKTVRSDTLEKDEMTLRTPNTDRTRRDNFILDSQWILNEDGSETFHWNTETDTLANSVRTQKKTETEWISSDGRLTGSYSETNLSDKTHPARTVVLDADISDSHEYIGTLEIIDKNDKIETGSFLVGFQIFPAITELVTAVQPESQALSPEEYPEIRDSIESFVLQELIRIPEEDLTFIKEDLPEAIWSQLLIMNESGKESAQ